jgi:hypothetical protein
LYEKISVKEVAVKVLVRFIHTTHRVEISGKSLCSKKLCRIWIAE